MSINAQVDTSTIETGCYVGGHWGIYGPGRVIALAEDFGYRVSPEYAAWRDSTDERDDSEFEIWECDAAEQWLNDYAAASGHIWGWSDGEFYYWSAKTWEEN